MTETQRVYQDLARERKASTLAAYLWEQSTPECRRDPEFPSEVRRASAYWWSRAASEAGVKALSEDSQAIVVVKLALLVNAERRGLPEACPKCDGSGERSLAPTCGHRGACPCDGPVVPCDCLNGLVACQSCGDRIGLVATPAGFSCVPCAHRSFPELAESVARYAMGPQLVGAR